MSDRINVDSLARNIMSVLNDYKDATEAAMAEAVDATAKEAVNELRNANPAGAGKYHSWADYNKGWTFSVLKSKKSAQAKVVHNKTGYRLTHLLEKGHALVKGGRTQAFEHIAPVNDMAEKMLITELQKRIK